MEQNKFNLKEVKVHRTLEATIFEIAFVIVAIIVWGIIIWMIQQAPDIVPTHFDASGKPNAYGSPSGIIIPCIILLLMPLAVVYMMLGMSSPSPAPFFAVFGLLFLEIIVFMILINKAK